MPTKQPAVDTSVILRIVILGPPRAGKTTTCRSLGRGFGEDVVTPEETDDGQTVYFDWMEHIGGRHKGKPILTRVVSAPGHDREKRLELLSQADVVLFVADSTATGLPESIQHFEEMKRAVAAYDRPPGTVVQANKRDLHDSLPIDQFRRLVGLSDDDLVIETNAANGDGVRQAFVYAVRCGLERLDAKDDREHSDDFTIDALMDRLQRASALNQPAAVEQAAPVEDAVENVLDDVVEASIPVATPTLRAVDQPESFAAEPEFPVVDRRVTGGDAGVPVESGPAQHVDHDHAGADPTIESELTWPLNHDEQDASPFVERRAAPAGFVEPAESDPAVSDPDPELRTVADDNRTTDPTDTEQKPSTAAIAAMDLPGPPNRPDQRVPGDLPRNPPETETEIEARFRRAIIEHRTTEAQATATPSRDADSLPRNPHLDVTPGAPESAVTTADSAAMPPPPLAGDVSDPAPRPTHPSAPPSNQEGNLEGETGLFARFARALGLR